MRIAFLNPALALSYAAAVLAALASAFGVLGVPYALEAPSWAAQGVGQDVANLALLLPALAVATMVARRGSAGARLVWVGLLLYVVYSYMLYAFFLHFGATFLLYVATLGVAFYALVGAVTVIARSDAPSVFQTLPWRRATGGYLVLLGTAFALLWLAEIVPAASAGVPPASALEAGLWTNPVHVLDLAFVLPGMILAGVAVWRRRSCGYALALPLVTFGVAMGAAILAMMVSLYWHGLPFAWPPTVFVGFMVLLGTALVAALLRKAA